ncbi:MAG: SRPBCC family protein [Trueperaceae bacterium]
MTDAALQNLSFTVSGRISRPCEEVYELVADPARLSKYFTTGGAHGRLEPGAAVNWDFHDFPGAFPVTVLEAEPPRRLVIEWGGGHVVNPAGTTRVTFAFEPLDGNTRTLVTIHEEAWQATPEGAKAAFGNCEGWTQMLSAMKAWAEHGVVLREGFYL